MCAPNRTQTFMQINVHNTTNEFCILPKKKITLLKINYKMFARITSNV